MAATSTSLSLPAFLPLLRSKPGRSAGDCKAFVPLHFTSTVSGFPRRKLIFQNPLHKTAERGNRRWRIYVEGGEALSLDSTTLDASQQLVPTSGDGSANNVISILLFVAFIGLSILTIGVVYIAVTDFLQKREGEKFEKEESTKKKNGGKKKKIRARPGPRGFGQKIEEDEELD